MEHRRREIMAQSYTASVKQNPGRKAWLIEFRHPLKNDSENRPGKKMRKGLGAVDEVEARRLGDQLNDLLRSENLWSLGARAEALKHYDEKVVEIFYGEIEPRVGSALDLRDKLLPLPGREEGYARILLLGVPGAGKTTLVRQLIGTNPKSERFPSTSVNRTTTFPTEIALKEGDFEAVVSFMSEHETRFEVEEALSASIVEGVDHDSAHVARSFLERSDMRFRLKYLLGDYLTVDEVVDPYEDEDLDKSDVPDEAICVSDAEHLVLQSTLNAYIERIMGIASDQRALLEAEQGDLAGMSAEDRNAALDLIEEQAQASDQFLELVSDILEELKSKFEAVTSGRFEKTTTGWPKAWFHKAAVTDRAAFLSAVRCFSGISYLAWGKLLTPLVTGLRTVGPFKPIWAEESARLVLVDTEGLGHKANTTADLPDNTLLQLHAADVILLVDSAKNGMASFSTGKAIEAVVNAGHTRKLAVVFTHMDSVKGDNLRGKAKIDHVFGGIRNIAENQLAKNVSIDAARYLIEHLETNTYYVGCIDEFDPKPAIPELNKLLSNLASAQPKVTMPVAFPDYSQDNLVLAIQEAARDFRQQWQGMLGISPHPDYRPKHWQTIKALSRRYAEGWDDGFELRPTSNLVTALSSAVSRFLETPIGWNGNPTPEQKRETMDCIKTSVANQLDRLSNYRLREQPQPAWLEAYALRGTGSTYDRRLRIENIYERWVPIPDARGDRLVVDFLTQIKKVVMDAIQQVEEQVRGQHQPPAGESEVS